MKLSELLNECEKFLNSKQEEVDKNEILATFNFLKIKPRIPLAVKVVGLSLMETAMLTLSDFEREDSIMFRVRMEEKMFYSLLLSYTDVERDITDSTIEMYDIALLSGLIDFIEEKCQKDYNNLKQIYMDTLNIGNLIKTTKAFEGVAQLDAEPLLKAMEEVKGKMTDDELQAIKTIFEYNDPTLHKIKAVLDDGALKS